MSGASGSYSRVSVRVGSDWRVRCLTVTGHSPVLDIDAGEIEISVSLAGQEIRASAVEFAAELAREAARFAAEVERLYAGQQAAAQDGTGRGHGGLSTEAGRGGWSWYLRPPPCLPTSGMKRRGTHRMRSSRKGAVTGESFAQVNNPDPFAPPVWRSPVYRTPEFVIWLVQLVRLLARVLWFVICHPLLDMDGRADRSGLSQPRLAGPGRDRPGSSWRSSPRCGWAGRLCSPGW